MSVTNTSYSTNSYKVTISNELVNSNNTIDGVNTAITTLGWSLYDSINQTTYSPMVTRVYRVLNADGTSYKYAILRWNTVNLNFNLSTCESWDTTAKVPTNESWHNAGCFYQGYDLRDSFIFVSATSRHLLLQPFIRNEPGLWTAILETERAAAEDIAANSAPCFFYTNSLMFGTPWGTVSANNTTSKYMVAFPRTPDNQTGAAAAKIYAPVTTRGMYPPYYPSANTANVGANAVSILQTMDGNALHLGSFYNTIGSWGWDASKAVVSPVSLDHIFKTMPFGRIYNAAVTKPIGSQSLDSTYINADTTGGWPSASGSNTEFLAFALNGGDEDTQFSNAAGRLSVSWSNANNVIYGSVVAVGNNVWAAANNGVWTWDMNSGANTVPIQRYINSNGVIDIMFDGARSIWGTTNNGIIQIDTETYATNANISADLGTAMLNMDQKYIYASNRTRSTQPKVYTFWRANGNLSAHLNVGSALAGTTVFGKPVPDYKGFVYSVTLLGLQSSGSGVARQVVWSSEAANANVGASNNTYSSAMTMNWQTSFWYEYNNDALFFITKEATTAPRYIQYANVPNTNTWVATLSTTSGTGASVQVSQGYAGVPATSAGFDNHGDLTIMPRRGMLTITPRRVGANQSSQTSWHQVTSMQHPDGSLGIGTPLSISTNTGNDIKNTTQGFPAHQWTNGVRIFQTIWVSNTEARIHTLGNLYPNTQFNLYPTGRLLIKA